MRQLVLAAALVLAALVVSCGEEPPPVDPRPTATPTLAVTARPGDVAVLDMALRTVNVPARVHRVVALSPSALEFAAAFDLEIVGRVSDATYPAEAASAATIGSTNAPKFDAIAALEPDLVIADAGLQGSLRTDFDQFPFPVFLIKVASYEDVLHAFRAVGEAVGQKDRAEELVGATEARVAAARDAVAGRPAPKVLILTGSGRDVYAGSDTSYTGALARLLGATNVLGAQPQGAPIAGFGLVEISTAAATSPDAVLLIAGAQSDLRSQVEGSPAWSATPAVRNNRLITLDPTLFLRSPGPRVADAVEQLARAIYP